MTKRCGRLIPSKVLSIVLLSMLTQRAAPGARKFLGYIKDEALILWIWNTCMYHVLVHLLVDVFNFLYDFGVFSMSDILTRLPEIQVLRWERRDTRWGAACVVKQTLTQENVTHGKRLFIAVERVHTVHMHGWANPSPVFCLLPLHISLLNVALPLSSILLPFNFATSVCDLFCIWILLLMI